MALRTYTIYLEGGAALNIKAARFEVKNDGVVFYNDDDQPLENTYIDPQAVIAVIPPSSSASGGRPLFPQA